MSFQTVLSIVGIAFTAFELYQRFRQKESSGSAQSPISPREEPKHSGGKAGAKLGALSEAPTSEAPTRVAERSETPRSAVSSKFGMV